jgi:hypothetical protein
MNPPERLAICGYLVLVGWLTYRYAVATYRLALGIFFGVYGILEELRGESRRTRTLVRASAARARADDKSASE